MTIPPPHEKDKREQFFKRDDAEKELVASPLKTILTINVLIKIICLCIITFGLGYAITQFWIGAGLIPNSTITKHTPIEFITPFDSINITWNHEYSSIDIENLNTKCIQMNTKIYLLYKDPDLKLQIYDETVNKTPLFTRFKPYKKDVLHLVTITIFTNNATYIYNEFIVPSEMENPIYSAYGELQKRMGGLF